jgi:transcriptional regulator with XRE-family HTH domain
MDDQDPRFALAAKLRTLREAGLAGKKITQNQLAAALGRGKPVSVPLVSSYESKTAPQIPPPGRLEGYAAIFATPRSFEGDELRMLDRAEMTEPELQAAGDLKLELARLRTRALGATSPAETTSDAMQADLSLSTGPFRFSDGNTITIVCAPWPQHMLQQIPYTKINDPDYIETLTYSELDALFELHGHIRASNPVNQVNRRLAGNLTADDYSSHVISLGGIDWNTATSTTLMRLQLPVRQVADWDIEDGQYFEVTVNGEKVRHLPRLEMSAGPGTEEGQGSKGNLLEDVALFARAVSPFNKRRTVTICNGMYGRGTYGVVRALTDARFRDRNAAYLRSRFGDSKAYCLLTRVPIVDGATLTPDWTTGEYTLFEWSE